MDSGGSKYYRIYGMANPPITASGRLAARYRVQAIPNAPGKYATILRVWRMDASRHVSAPRASAINQNP